MNRCMKLFRAVVVASGLFAGLAVAGLSAHAADDPDAAKSKPAEKAKPANQNVADEDSSSRADKNQADKSKAKPRKAADKSAGRPAEKKGADQKNADQDKKNSKKSAKKLEEKTNSSAEAQEAAALALVGAHHPELLDLLEKLKADNSKQYQQAILELYRASQRLADRKAKDPARYELELKAWKLDSQARLLAAKLTMDADAELEEQLKSVLAEREDVAIALLAMDRERLADRLKQTERQLEKRREQRDARAKHAFEQLTKRSGKPRKNQAAKDAQAAKAAKPANPSPSEVKENAADSNQTGETSASKTPAVVKP